MTRTVKVVGVLLGGVGVVVAVWVLGMRDKGSPVVAMQRRVNRAVVNPRQMATAGRPGAYASVIVHTGRTSGRVYHTPVGAERTADGFMIALVYGSGTDWLKNVLSAGSATIVHDGVSHEVDSPQVVPLADIVGDLPPGTSRSSRLFGVTEALTLRLAA